MMNSQGSDADRINLIQEGKKIGINEVIMHNEFINNSLKPQIWYLHMSKNEIILFKV